MYQNITCFHQPLRYYFPLNVLRPFKERIKRMIKYSNKFQRGKNATVDSLKGAQLKAASCNLVHQKPCLNGFSLSGTYSGTLKCPL